MKRVGMLCLLLALLLAFSAPAAMAKSHASIRLYGETHSMEAILNHELKLWRDCYHNEHMRNLFVELPYYTAQFLNLWMQQQDDALFDAVYDEWTGTACHSPEVRAFYAAIKAECPETVFHGTDVGHQFQTTGERYLHYLQQNGQAESEEYRLVQENMAQGERFYREGDAAYRENMMVENFIRAYDALRGVPVMGIYGSAHTDASAMDYETGTVPGMAAQLYARYGDALYTESLTWIALDVAPLRMDTLEVAGKAYEASYFGQQDISGFSDTCVSRDFWRLENAYEYFKGLQTSGDVLPYDNYPMLIEQGQAFVVEYTLRDGSTVRFFYRSDGTEWQGMPTTVGVAAE